MATLVSTGVQTSHSDGYCFQVETTWRAARRGLRVVEVPIEFVERARGESKMSAGIVLEAVLRVLVWRFGDLTRRTSDPGWAGRRVASPGR